MFYVKCNYCKKWTRDKQICNLQREYIKSRRDIGITRLIMMHQVLYIVQLPNEDGDMHAHYIKLGAS